MCYCQILRLKDPWEDGSHRGRGAQNAGRNEASLFLGGSLHGGSRARRPCSRQLLPQLTSQLRHALSRLTLTQTVFSEVLSPNNDLDYHHFLTSLLSCNLEHPTVQHHIPTSVQHVWRPATDPR